MQEGIRMISDRLRRLSSAYFIIINGPALARAAAGERPLGRDEPDGELHRREFCARNTRRLSHAETRRDSFGILLDERERERER